VVRALTVDASFRILVAVTTDTVREAAAAQSIDELAASELGELMTGAILLREATNPKRRVQVIMTGGGRPTLVADTQPDGSNRGIVRPAESDGPSSDARVRVSYTLPNGALHQGVVAVPNDGGISGALMHYMQASEQVVATLAVSVGPTLAAGYLVQILPGADRGSLETMTERLTAMQAVGEPFKGSSNADELLERLAGEGGYQRLSDAELRFGCTCSEERILMGLRSLGRDDLDEMLQAAEDLDIRCDACGRRYAVTVDDLRAAFG
jgi:molecular chaperone Hsp33